MRRKNLILCLILLGTLLLPCYDASAQTELLGTWHLLEARSEETLFLLADEARALTLTLLEGGKTEGSFFTNVLKDEAPFLWELTGRRITMTSKNNMVEGILDKEKMQLLLEDLLVTCVQDLSQGGFTPLYPPALPLPQEDFYGTWAYDATYQLGQTYTPIPLADYSPTKEYGNYLNYPARPPLFFEDFEITIDETNLTLTLKNQQWVCPYTYHGDFLLVDDEIFTSVIKVFLHEKDLLSLFQVDDNPTDLLTMPLGTPFYARIPQ